MGKKGGQLPFGPFIIASRAGYGIIRFADRTQRVKTVSARLAGVNIDGHDWLRFVRYCDRIVTKRQALREE